MTITRTERQEESGGIREEKPLPGNFKRTEHLAPKFGGGKFGVGKFSRKRITRQKI